MNAHPPVAIDPYTLLPSKLHAKPGEWGLDCARRASPAGSGQ